MFIRPRALSMLACLLVLGAGTSSAVADAEPRSFTLAPGGTAFWSGPGGAAPDCGPACWTYTITVTEPAYRLRVGIDRPILGNVWRMELVDPSGSTVGSASPGTDLYSAEVADHGALTGTYTVRITAQNASDRRFRMRAKLETDNGGLPTGRVPVRPDLQPMPPWEFSFKQPVTNGATGGASVGVGVPGGRPSCHPEEIVQDTTVRCLRMSYGVANVGLGPLELEVGPGNLLMDRPLTQRVRNSDGSLAATRNAGNAYFHHSHAHYHHDKAIGLQLLRVVDSASGILQPAADPHLKGFAHRDELLRGWTQFRPTWQKQGFGLLPGWADYYEWDRPGNYIDFGSNPNGLYVVRIVADPEGYILETDPTDNVAYSLIRVTGDQVEHLQSGIGSDPWDPCRLPLPLGPEWKDSFELTEPRPEHCPSEA